MTTKRRSAAWISCSDRLPTPGEVVIVQHQVGRGLGVLRNGLWLLSGSPADAFLGGLFHPTAFVTHWQPMPEGPALASAKND